MRFLKTIAETRWEENRQKNNIEFELHKSCRDFLQAVGYWRPV